MERNLMSGSITFALAFVAALAPVAAFACSAEDMAGTWKCGGGYKACVVGRDVSRVFQAADGSWRLQDGVGYEAKLALDGDKLTASYVDGPRAGGDALTATVDPSCRKIAWSSTHEDDKQ
jgi:hypothetical protein